MATTFLVLCGLVFYVYAGYPLLLHIRARLSPKRIHPDGGSNAVPSVSIVIAARNEGARLAGRIENIRQLDYPAAKRQIVVVSDGSTDNTLDVLSAFGAKVDAVVLDAGGKARALNAGVARARHDIVVFADVRQGFAPDALRALVAPFRDRRVGAVSGELVLNGESRDRRSEEERRALESRRALEDRRHVARRTPGKRKGERRWFIRRTLLDSTITEGVGLYWRYEKQIRRDESASGSVVGATGAIYAMRRSLWQPLPPDTILDDVLAPMRCVMAGYRVVFEERACAFDRPATDASTEGRRKLRTLAGNYQLLRLEPRLLLPWRNPVWIQFMSHKVGRLAVPYALPAILALSLLLARRSPVYAAACVAQCAFYLLAAYGARLERIKKVRATAPRVASVAPPVHRLARVAHMFVVMNRSVVDGLVALLTRQKVW